MSKVWEVAVRYLATMKYLNQTNDIGHKTPIHNLVINSKLCLLTKILERAVFKKLYDLLSQVSYHNYTIFCDVDPLSQI